MIWDGGSSVNYSYQANAKKRNFKKFQEIKELPHEILLLFLKNFTPVEVAKYRLYKSI